MNGADEFFASFGRSLDCVPYTRDDLLKYFSRRAASYIDWVVDTSEDSESEPMESLADFGVAIKQLTLPLIGDDWDKYSDGRAVELTVEVQHGHKFTQLWHPDPAKDVKRTYTGALTEKGGTYTIEVIPPGTICVAKHAPEKPNFRVVNGDGE